MIPPYFICRFCLSVLNPVNDFGNKCEICFGQESDPVEKVRQPLIFMEGLKPVHVHLIKIGNGVVYKKSGQRNIERFGDCV